ncbi:twin transmembrane helix small protein [Nitrobacter winogradskyi]|uniref:twin transmembrane helix small protein n=1 Tax=Nitrobacter winogradskyi TaxID=913 RepID=UPI0002FEAAE5|nr:twin transmembrane helix small protein [Nitrobacter winogradskyi]
MTEFLRQVLVPIAVASVAAVLILGLVNMIRGGNPWRSQYLMQTRVVLQFVAIVMVMMAVWSMMGRQ